MVKILEPLQVVWPIPHFPLPKLQLTHKRKLIQKLHLTQQLQSGVKAAIEAEHGKEASPGGMLHSKPQGQNLQSQQKLQLHWDNF